MVLYLDNCCFNRPFDNQLNIKTKLETEAKIYVQDQIKSGKIRLVWSYMLDFENSANSFAERKEAIAGWEKYADRKIYPNESILKTAIDLHKLNIKSKDAIHIACAVEANCEFFLTTDYDLIRKMHNFNQLKVKNPLEILEFLEI